MSSEQILLRKIKQLQKEVNKRKEIKDEPKPSILTNKGKLFIRLDLFKKDIVTWNYAGLRREYEKRYNKKSPPATKDWLTYAIRRAEQRKAYMELLGKIPDKVLENDKVFDAQPIPLIINDIKNKIYNLQKSVTKYTDIEALQW